MNKILTPVLSLFVFLAPLQVYACTSFGEILFKGFVVYSIALVVLLAVLLFLYKIFGGKRSITTFKKVLAWFAGILIILIIAFTLYSHFTKSGKSEGIKCEGRFCATLCY